jgi:hypothetical protein
MEGHSSLCFITIITRTFVSLKAEWYWMTTHPHACHLSFGDGQCHKYSHIWHQLVWDHLSELNFETLWAPQFTLLRLSHILVVLTSLTENLRPQLLLWHTQAVVRTTPGPIFTSLKTWLWLDKGKLPDEPCDDSSWFSQDLCNQALLSGDHSHSVWTRYQTYHHNICKKRSCSVNAYRKENLICTLCTFHCLLIWWRSWWCKQVNKFNDYLSPTICLPQIPGLYSYEASG